MKKYNLLLLFVLLFHLNAYADPTPVCSPYTKFDVYSDNSPPGSQAIEVIASDSTVNPGGLMYVTDMAPVTFSFSPTLAAGTALAVISDYAVNFHSTDVPYCTVILTSVNTSAPSYCIGVKAANGFVCTPTLNSSGYPTIDAPKLTSTSGS